jgi:hypothetical protein
MTKSKGHLDVYYRLSARGEGHFLRILVIHKVLEYAWCGATFQTTVSAKKDVRSILDLVATFRPITNWNIGGRCPEWLKSLVERGQEIQHYYVVLDRFPPDIERKFSDFHKKNSLRVVPFSKDQQSETFRVVKQNGHFLEYRVYTETGKSGVSVRWDSAWVSGVTPVAALGYGSFRNMTNPPSQ